MIGNVSAEEQINLMCSTIQKQSSDNISMNESTSKYYLNIIDGKDLFIRYSLSTTGETLKVNKMNNSVINAKSQVDCVDCFYINEVSIDRLSGDISIYQSLVKKEGNGGFIYSEGNCRAMDIKKPKF